MKQKTYAISFEFYPPKTEQGSHHLNSSAKQLAEAMPEFFSVTFGAGGSTRDATIQTVQSLQQLLKQPIAPHLSCIGFTKNELVQLIHLYQAMGVKRILALRGDMPSGMGGGGELKYAYELVQLIRDTTHDHFRIDVAAYPECHPQAKNFRADILNLQKKFAHGANGAITQYFYNPDAYFYFLDECAKHHIDFPIVPGIMPITQFTNLVRFSDICQAEVPRWLYKRLESYGDDIASIQALGLEVVTNLCERLLTGGAPGLHFYTLNHAKPAMQILAQLGLEQHTNKVAMML